MRRHEISSPPNALEAPTNDIAKRNLRDTAAEWGVDPERLVFAKRAPLTVHLARQRLPDLFLDTFNYNAHTTASDVLWAGLPVLTKMGQSFASRAYIHSAVTV